MSELVAHCPRCDSRKITFDIGQAHIIREAHGWQCWYEAFCICRHCHRATIFVLSENVGGDYEYVHKVGLLNIPGAVNSYVDVEGFVNVGDLASVQPPDHIPGNVERVFCEGARCLAFSCYNAAGTMFRLCIDIVTREMLPNEDSGGLNPRIRRNLGLRLPWLFEHGKVPEALHELSTCVREDGNDGAHAGSLTAEDAEDLLDFTHALLERLYSEPERLRLAKARRDERRRATDDT